MQLTGSLGNLELRSLIDFLHDVRQTGTLDLRQDGWCAQFGLRSGNVIAARLAAERGLSALMAVGLLIREATFDYVEGAGPAEAEFELTPEQLHDHLRSPRLLLSLDAIPVQTAAADLTIRDDNKVVLKRSALRQLIAVDGTRTIRELVGDAPMATSLRDFAGLVEAGLITVEAENAHPRTVMSVDARFVPHGSHDAGTPPRPTSRHVATPLAKAAPEREPWRTSVPAGGFPVLPMAAVAVVAAVLASAYLVFVQPTTARPRTALDVAGAAESQPTAASTLAAPITPTTSQTGRTTTPQRTTLDVAVAAESQPPAVALSAASVILPTPQTAPTATTATNNTGSATLLETSFATFVDGWRINPPPVRWSTGAYRLTSRTGQFVAVSAPLPAPVGDVEVSASLHKLGGPPGGGYGLIVRDQEPTARDGTNQTGHYYVVEVNDSGDVGAWRRDGDRWVELLGWTHSDAVRTGASTNELLARAVGSTLTFTVNGVEVTSQTDSTLRTGGVGLFTGGDRNEVGIDRFSVRHLAP